ncbi:MAG TPA: substrate-binding domain-containing protein [Clostridiaceae bacterium]|nr:substrate-binding domain-containing protein [Clostridiaceae bacterium]
MTTSEIAKKLGISRGTVSRVINNHPNVKEETRKKVLEALKASNYIPNEAARALVMKRNFKIAVVVFSEPKFFWKQVEFGVNSAHNELKPHGVKVEYFVTDILKPDEQLELLRDLPNQGFDAIAIAPNNPLLLVEQIDAISTSNIPVVIINVDIPTANRLCYVGCNYIHSGALACEILAKCMNYNGHVLILTLQDQVIAIEQRVTGFRQELSNYRNIYIDQVSRFNRLAEGVYDEVYSILNKNHEINGIYVSFGALEQTAQAVIDANMVNKVSVVGYDLSETIYDYMKKGAITATICHEPFNQGYFAVKILHNYLRSGIMPSSSIMYTKLEAIFSRNASYYLNEQKHLELFHL